MGPQNVTNKEGAEDNPQGIISHEIGCRQWSAEFILSRSCLGSSSHKAEEAEDGTDQLPPVLRPQSPHSEGDESSPNLGLFGPAEL